METPLWIPSPDELQDANVIRFIAEARRRWHAEAEDFESLWRWSVAAPERFWETVWDFCGVIGEKRGPVLVDSDRMPGARFFPESRLNFAENLLRRRTDQTAIVFWSENGLTGKVTFRELYDEVSRLAQALAAAGVRPGDRVAGYLPNLPGAVIAMLATASLGAIWSSCSPDFGVDGVVDRFGQIAPKVLFAADGYFYHGKRVDLMPRVRDILGRLPSVKRTVIVPYTTGTPALKGIRRAVNVHEFMAPYAPRDIAFARLPFTHPLYILYSSGTTGAPKCIVHGAGGTLLQHLKEHQLHTDLKPGERLFYFTTCGWMMWNWLVSGLASGATLVLYDGSPFMRRGNILFDLAQATHINVFGTSAKYLDAVAKLELRPRETHDLSALRAILSTGSPLAPESFDYVYREIKTDLQLASISGGTDIVSCFALGNPVGPVWRGELQSRGLGMAVDVFDDAGRPVRGRKGELVCTAPFPSMPVGFWNDPGDARYRAAYFERFPGLWCHGDYVELTAHDGLIIYGRSDATLNPGGVRIGTAEIYRQVEQLDEVVESLVIAQDWPPEQPRDVRIVLFVRLREGQSLTPALAEKIKARIKSHATPRHVPDRIVQVPEIPRTRSGKIVELAVRSVVHGQPVKNLEALANPEALEHFRSRPELRS